MLIGLSGGADSVALLLKLLEEGQRLTAVHVNHGLRGEASDGDEAFVRRLCREKGVPLLVYRAALPAGASEDQARQARYAFFRQAMAETGAQTLALAHHRDDQAETLLMHLLRGSGLRGLTGMAQETESEGMRVVRPLLHCSRGELRAYLLRCGQTWREDASNADQRYLRNAIRGDILPRLEELIPGAAMHLAQTAELLRGDEDALQELTEAFLTRHAWPDCLALDALLSQPPGLQRRILRRWWEASCPGRQERSLSLAQSEALAALGQSPAGTKCNLPGGWHAWRGWTHLHLLSPSALDAPEEQLFSEDVQLGGIRMAAEAYRGDPGDGRRTQGLPRAMLAENLTVRTRRSGDWIRPFGGGRQSLQDYLVNRRVDAPFRDRLALLCRGSEVLLVSGVGAGDIPRIEDTVFEHYILLRLEGDMPWCRENE